MGIDWMTIFRPPQTYKIVYACAHRFVAHHTL